MILYHPFLKKVGQSEFNHELQSWTFVISRNMTINDMDNFETPAKKMRLNDIISQWDNDDFGGDDDFAENDDIWGQGEITAEEFDLLEMQATQKIQNNGTINLQTASTSNSGKSIGEWKKQQYALEGKIKLLNDSLEKAVRELNKERFDKDTIVAQKTEEFQKQQKILKREIEKLQTCLQFKDQEMKHTQEKVCSLEQKMEKLKKNAACTASQQISLNARQSKQFLSKFDFEKVGKKTVESSVQTEDKQELRKTYQLSLISPRGDPKGGEVLSNLLVSQKQSTIPVFNHSSLQSPLISEKIDGCQHISIALARLNANQDTEGIWDFYDSFLKHHISFLQSGIDIDQKCGTLASSKSLFLRNAGNSLFQGVHVPFRAANIESYHSLASQCLKDLNQLLVWRSPQVNTHQSVNPLEHYEQILKPQIEQDIPMCSAPLFNITDISTQEPVCLLSLLALAKSETYPKSYHYKKDESLLALRALLSWSSHSSSSMVPYVYQFPLQSLTSGQQDIPFALLTLQLLTNLVNQKDFDILLHQRGSCILTYIAGLCHIVNDATKDDFTILLNLVEGSLCSIIAVLGPTTLQNENCQCSSQIVQGFILMLWHYYQTCNNDLFSTRRTTLNNGILTLYQLFSHVKNFREKRAAVEEHYILLICGLSRLTREHVHLKYLNDNVRELWDFQDECGEFDSDEPSSSGCGPCTSCKNGKS